MGLSRRRFLQGLGAACAACLAGPLGVPGLARAARELGMAPGLMGQRPSPFFEPLGAGHVRCTLCPHACQVGPGQRGACRVRQNIDGVYHTLVYGNPCAVHVDPIEKKPFFHVLPATRSYSIATAGCNFSCQFCQNWEISQQGPEDTFNVSLSPAQAVEEALASGSASLASTYVEPVIFMEYMLELGAQARAKGLLKVMHSNGFINPEPLTALMRVLDAACIDLKSAREDFYRKVCGGSLKPVQQTLRTLVRNKVHTEIVHLMIPTLNDDPAETRDLIAFVRDELSPETPMHFTRFHPRYRLQNLPPTPVAVLEQARRTALDMGLKFVYLGNVPGHPGENTHCPQCQGLLIRRMGMGTREVRLKQGRCPDCGRPIPGIWEPPQARG